MLLNVSQKIINGVLAGSKNERNFKMNKNERNEMNNRQLKEAVANAAITGLA